MPIFDLSPQDRQLLAEDILSVLEQAPGNAVSQTDLLDSLQKHRGIREALRPYRPASGRSWSRLGPLANLVSIVEDLGFRYVCGRRRGRTVMLVTL